MNQMLLPPLRRIFLTPHESQANLQALIGSSFKWSSGRSGEESRWSNFLPLHAGYILLFRKCVDDVLSLMTGLPGVSEDNSGFLKGPVDCANAPCDLVILVVHSSYLIPPRPLGI